MKKHILITILACLASTGLADTSVLIDGVVATVNNHVITHSDVLGSSRELQQLLASRRADRDALNKAYSQTLDDLINRKLIIDEYEDQRKIQIPPSMIDDRAESVVRDMFRDDRAAFLAALREDGQSERAWRNQIREQMIVSAMRNLRVDSQVSISPVAVASAFEKDPDAFATPPRVTFSMIVLARGETDEARAQQFEKLETVLDALKAGDTFADVARRYSEEAMATEGGFRDWIDVGQLRPELQDVLTGLDHGGVSEPTDLGGSRLIVKLHDRQTEDRVPFVDAYPVIERTLRQKKSQQLFEEWVERLRRDAFVNIIERHPF